EKRRQIEVSLDGDPQPVDGDSAGSGVGGDSHCQAVAQGGEELFYRIRTGIGAPESRRLVGDLLEVTDSALGTKTAGPVDLGSPGRSGFGDIFPAGGGEGGY